MSTRDVNNVNDVVLTWTHLSPNTAYEVHRSTTPYFTPSDHTRQITLTAPTATYTDWRVGNVNENYFYVVKSKFVDSANDLSVNSTNE